jgi:CheY-like chemotaxis protein
MEHRVEHRGCGGWKIYGGESDEERTASDCARRQDVECYGTASEVIQTKREIMYNKLDLSNKKALIIDDEKINTIIIRRLMKQFKIKIDFTPNPREGIGMASSEEYDIIFVNHEMKDITGKEVVRKIEASGNKVPPVVGLTSISDELEEENCYDAHIMCPIEFRELNRVINKIFK